MTVQVSTPAGSGGRAGTRGAALGALAVVVGLGLLLQLDRSQAWTDPAGTVLYVVAAGLLVLVVRPVWPPWLAAALAGAVSVTIEFGQRQGGPAEWVPRSGPLRLLLGSTFSLADVCWIIAGTAVAWLVVRTTALAGASSRNATPVPVAVEPGDAERFPVLGSTTPGHARRPSWQTGLMVATAGVMVLLFGGFLGAAIESGGRRLPGLIAWAPTVTGLAIVVAGAIDTWRGLSRDDRRPDPAAVSLRVGASLAVAVVAVVTGAGMLGAAHRSSGPVQLAVVVAASLTLAVVFSGIAGWGDGVPQRGRAVVGTFTAAATMALTLGVADVSAPSSEPVPPPTIATAPTPSRPMTAGAPVPPPAAPRSPAPDAPADVPLCRVEQLRAHTEGWDAAMGDTAVTVVVTNTGGRDCAVAGLPTISLLQGRSRVDLRIDHRSLTHPGRTERPRRALVRARAHVRVALGWAGHRTRADQRTAQALTLHAPGVGSLPVELDHGPAPFDLLDGARVSISAWR